jgi:hypothetical protein
MVFIWFALLLSLRFKPARISHLIIGIATIAYSLTYDVIFGNQLGLYFYLDRGNSTFYMVLSGTLIYPFLNILYVLFLPDKRKYILPYTGAYIIAMLLFEYLTVIQRIIIMTGWKPIPWSIVTYVFTYLWINLLYRYIEKKISFHNA